jgi:MFS family permease
VIIPVTITLGVQALVSMVAVAVPIFMSVASGELNFSPSFVGIFVSLIYLGATASAPVSGYIVDRFGPILISQIGLLLCALGLALISSGSPFWMVCGALVIGSGYGPVTPASTNLLIKTTPLNMISLVFSIKQTGVPVGGALAGAVGPLLLLSYGWRTAAMGVAGLSLISTLAIQPFRKHYDNDRPEKIQFSWNQLIAPIMMAFSNQGLRPVVVASFFFATMQLSVISYIVSYLTQDIGMTLVRAGFMLSAAQFGGIIGRIFWGVIADRFLNSRIMLGILGIAMSATAFLLAMFSAQWSHSGILAVCILFGSVAIGWNGVYLAEVACSVKPKHTGMATGGSLFFTYCGVLIGLPVFSLIVDKTDSYPVGFFSTAICVGICGMILFFSRASHTRSYRIDS